MVARSGTRFSGPTHRSIRQAKAAVPRMAMIRVAVIGAGQWGPNLIRNFHNKETSEVVWIVDRDATRLNEVHAHFPDVQVAENPEQHCAIHLFTPLWSPRPQVLTTPWQKRRSSGVSMSWSKNP